MAASLDRFDADTLRALTPAYRGHAGAWEGVLKQDGEIVWSCGHRHRNREQSSRFYPAAVSCAAKARLDALLKAEPYTTTTTTGRGNS